MTEPSFPARLAAGYRAFAEGRLSVERGRYEALAAEGQHPEVMVIGCCDSRVAPETIFDAGPGELFVVRNVANLVPPYEPDGARHATSAALEFGVQALRVRHIVVLGHAACGGVRAFADEDARPLSPGDFIGSWMSLLEPVAARVPRTPGEALAPYAERLGHASVIASLANLRGFPCVSILAGRGRLHLHGAYFGVATGVLSVLDEGTGEFRPAADTKGRRSLFACT